MAKKPKQKFETVDTGTGATTGNRPPTENKDTANFGNVPMPTGFSGESMDVKTAQNTPLGGTTGGNSAGGNPNRGPNGEKLPYAIQQYTPQMATLADAPDIPDYLSPKWSNDYLNNIDTSYYTNAVQRYKDYAEKNRASQLGEAEKAQKSALTQAYVTKLQNEKKLADAMARAGIRGGATESSMMNLANQYGQARNAANSDYSNAVNAINAAIDSNIFDYQSDMDARAEEYRQNMGQAQWQADRENYGNTYQANLDRLWNIYNAQNDLNMANIQAQNDANKSYIESLNNAYINDYNAKREDKQNANANAEFGTPNYWANHYANWGNKKLNNLHDKLTKQLQKLRKGKENKAQKKEIARLEARLAGVNLALGNNDK